MLGYFYVYSILESILNNKINMSHVLPKRRSRACGCRGSNFSTISLISIYVPRFIPSVHPFERVEIEIEIESLVKHVHNQEAFCSFHVPGAIYVIIYMKLGEHIEHIDQES